jgi:hypothetical protein
MIIAIHNAKEQPNVLKYLKTCQDFENAFIDYIKSNNFDEDLIGRHIDDYWYNAFYKKDTDSLSEYDHIIFNKLKKQKRHKKFKDVLDEKK